jgi:hypothetical protein
MRRSFGIQQVELERGLTDAVREALRLAGKAEASDADCIPAYRQVAEILVNLRHQFKGPDGETADLRGRSAGYREIVHRAYEAAGASSEGPIHKRLTVGVAYWVRKLLIQRYGEVALRGMGLLPAKLPAVANRRSALSIPTFDDPAKCFDAVVGLLNQLASDPMFIPGEDGVRSARRAVHMLEMRVSRSNLSIPHGSAA